MMTDERKKQFLFALQTTLPSIAKDRWRRPDDWLPYLPPLDPLVPRNLYETGDRYTDEQLYDNAIMILSRGKGEISIDVTCHGQDGRAYFRNARLFTRQVELGNTRSDTVVYDDEDMRWHIWYTLGGRNLICDLYSDNSPEILEIVVGKDIGRLCALDPVIIDSSMNTPIHLAIPMYSEDMSRICDTRGCECIELYGSRDNYSYHTYTKIDYKEED